MSPRNLAVYATTRLCTYLLMGCAERLRPSKARYVEGRMLMKRDAVVTELMDAESLSPEQLHGPLEDLSRLNWLLGWRWLAVAQVRRIVEADDTRGFSLLDVASGAADIPASIAEWAARKGIPARIVATDVHPSAVAVARARTAGIPNLSVERADAMALAYPDESFDIALCTLALHHFGPDDAVRVLRNLGRVGRHVLVFDLVRTWGAYGWAYLLTRITTRDAITRHDGPASVRRAYTARELRQLAVRAGLRDVRVREHFPYRLVLDAGGTV